MYFCVFDRMLHNYASYIQKTNDTNTCFFYFGIYENAASALYLRSSMSSQQISHCEQQAATLGKPKASDRKKMYLKTKKPTSIFLQ